MTNTQFTIPTWHHIANVWDDDSDLNTAIYVDGSADSIASGTLSSVGDLSNTQDFMLGMLSTGSNYPFNGALDEVRIASVARSAGWNATEENNQGAPGSFYSVGLQESSGCAPTATPTPTATAVPNNVFYFYDEMSPFSFMMGNATPSGGAWNANATTNFYSDIIPAGSQLSAGTTTIRIWFQFSVSRDVTMTLYRGSTAGGWTSIGTNTWPVDTGGLGLLLSMNLATGSYTFGPDEHLRFEVNFDGGGNPAERISWDGIYWESRIEVPSITP